MSKTFDNGQLRGAYAAGLEAGVKLGAERMRREGWRRWKDGDPIPQVGQIVKTLVPTIGGWIGLGSVKHSGPYWNGVIVWKLDQLTGDPDEDYGKTAELRYDEVAIRYNEDA